MNKENKHGGVCFGFVCQADHGRAEQADHGEGSSRHTLNLYLDGKIDQFWFRDDTPGVFFLINAASVEEAKSMVEALPLAANGYLACEYIPVGPLKPLGLLIQLPESK